MKINDTENSTEAQLYDYTKLITEDDNDGIWIIIGISLFMIAILIWVVFF